MAYNVLIVDDSRTMRRVIQKCITLSGFAVEKFWEAGDGKEALAILRAREVDLIVSDLNMPEMNGIEMLKEMKKDERLGQIPVLFITTLGQEKVMQEAFDLGVKEYLQKPFHPEALRDVLNRSVGKSLG